MTGPDHFREAEKLLDRADGEGYGTPEERYLVNCAQVHATLALAAATALQPSQRDAAGAEQEAWRKAAGVTR